MLIRTDRLGGKLSEGIRALFRWMEREGVSQNALGRRLGVDSGTVCRWLHGDKAPSRKWAVAIERETGVPVAAWDEIPRGSIPLHAAKVTARKKAARGASVQAERVAGGAR